MRPLSFYKLALCVAAAAATLSSCRTLHQARSREELSLDSARVVRYDTAHRSEIREATQGRSDSSAYQASETQKAGTVKISLDPRVTGRAVLWDAQAHKLRRFDGAKWIEVSDSSGAPPPRDTLQDLEIEITPADGKDYANGVKIRAPGNTREIEVSGVQSGAQSHLVNFSKEEQSNIQRDDATSGSGSDSRHVKKQLTTVTKSRSVSGISPVAIVSALVLLLAVASYFIARRYFTGRFL